MGNDPMIRDLERRIAALEKAVFSPKKPIKQYHGSADYSGCTAAVRFLISKNFFGKKRSLGEIRAEADKHDYHYSTQAYHEALKRLSEKGGPLVTLKESGKKLYANRK